MITLFGLRIRNKTLNCISYLNHLENKYNFQFKMSVTLHTDIGNLKLELFCDSAPKACKNFLALCASGYYDGCVFHRNIKGFIGNLVII